MMRDFVVFSGLVKLMMILGAAGQEEFDVIVVGSGPGGTGVLLRLLQLAGSSLRIAWLEKGRDITIRNWPEDLETNSDVFDPIPRTSLTWNRVCLYVRYLNRS